jgi:CBS-domain-containing membrane protein
VERLSAKLDRILAQIDDPLQATFVSGNDAFLQCVAALEQHLAALLATLGTPRPNAGLAELLDHAPVDDVDKKWLHEMRKVRNAVAHHEGVHVTPEFGRELIFSLRRIATVLDRTEVVAGTIMFPNPTVVRPWDPIAKAQGLMLAHEYSQLPVADDQEALMGLITDVSILRRLQQENAVADPRKVRVEEARGGCDGNP